MNWPLDIVEKAINIAANNGFDPSPTIANIQSDKVPKPFYYDSYDKKYYVESHSDEDFKCLLDIIYSQEFAKYFFGRELLQFYDWQEGTYYMQSWQYYMGQLYAAKLPLLLLQNYILSLQAIELSR